MIWVALGAGLGALARAGLSLALPLWGTLLANALGSVLIGLLAAWPMSARMRGFAMTGFCGGFTTFSLFGLETFALLAEARYTPAAAYVAATLALSLGGVALGLSVGKRLRSDG
ncbi:fluoride efflux transporter FluC [Roseibaca sp. Y0-43]|uniref:fluoride efflux transporter FluC n=1 Tax=Roseibaca sp. Y0-43 TaxID=2816854 RepID=UPI001D0C6414|nr:CrcB family protein [Roseibaca sp. Y0-43]MCC1481367.1 CrcB family protein [Roseibaca sp. Y0-43]